MKPTLLILALLWAACSPEGSRLGRMPHWIIGGTPTTGDPEVVGLIADWITGAPIVCTGTMISDEHVLTAAHCVVDTTNRPVYMPKLFICPDRWTDGINPDCFVAPVYSDPDVWGYPWVHPDFDINSADLAHDIAVFRVVPFGVAPKPLPAGPLPPSAVGSEARIVGYGVTDAATQEGSETRRRAQTVITHIGPLPDGQTGPNPWGLIDSAFQNAGMPNTCQGDSGGPLFWPAGAAGETVVGVVSWGDEHCDQFGVNVDVGAHLCWLEEIGVPGATCPPPPQDGADDEGGVPGDDGGIQGDDGAAAGDDAAQPGDDATPRGDDAAVSDESDGSDQSDRSDTSDGGCSCTSRPGEPLWLALLALALFFSRFKYLSFRLHAHPNQHAHHNQRRD